MPGASIFKAVKLDDKGTLTYNVAIDVHGRKHILVFNKTGKFLKKGDDLVNSANNPASAGNHIHRVSTNVECPM